MKPVSKPANTVQNVKPLAKPTLSKKRTGNRPLTERQRKFLAAKKA